jgi:hypothetical protein
MGTWGHGIFDNDTACDWAYLLEGSKDLSVVRNALDKVLSAGSKYLRMREAEEALAACEVIARLRGNFGDRNAYTESVDSWVISNKKEVPAKLINKSLAAIERILYGPSELSDLWNPDGGYSDWKNNVDNLVARIRA